MNAEDLGMNAENLGMNPENLRVNAGNVGMHPENPRMNVGIVRVHAETRERLTSEYDFHIPEYEKHTESRGKRRFSNSFRINAEDDKTRCVTIR